MKSAYRAVNLSATWLVLAGAMAVFAVGCGGKAKVAADTAPVSVSMPQPAYPEAARKAGIEGKAMLEVTVGADGAVLSATLAQSSGNGALDTAALQAVTTARFTPATKAGKPVEARVTVPYQFKLN
jgi:TonB family protein